MTDIFNTVDAGTPTAGAVDTANGDTSEDFDTSAFLEGFLEGTGESLSDFESESETSGTPTEGEGEGLEGDAEETQEVQETQGEQDVQQVQDTQEVQGKPLSVTVHHLGKEVTLAENDLVVAAQKGLNYDYVNTEKERLRAERAEIESILAPEAAKMGLSVSDYLKSWQLESRSAVIKEQYLSQGIELPDAVAKDMAKLQIGKEAEAKDIAAKAEKERLAADSSARLESLKNKVLEEANAVLKTYGLEELPQSVLASIADGVSPEVAYLRYLDSERQREIGILKQNERNRAKSPAPRKKEGNASGGDPFLEGLLT